MRKIIVAAALAAAFPGGALAGPAADAALARVHGDWGAELGASWRFGEQGFRITPTAGLLLGDVGGDDVNWFGRVEAGYEFPIFVEAGVGARIDEWDTKPYLYGAIDLAPLIGLKANVGDGYAALGLTLNY